MSAREGGGNRRRGYQEELEIGRLQTAGEVFFESSSAGSVTDHATACGAMRFTHIQFFNSSILQFPLVTLFSGKTSRVRGEAFLFSRFYNTVLKDILFHYRDCARHCRPRPTSTQPYAALLPFPRHISHPHSPRRCVPLQPPSAPSSSYITEPPCVVSPARPPPSGPLSPLRNRIAAAATPLQPHR